MRFSYSISRSQALAILAYLETHGVLYTAPVAKEQIIQEIVDHTSKELSWLRPLEFCFTAGWAFNSKLVVTASRVSVTSSFNLRSPEITALEETINERIAQIMAEGTPTPTEAQ